MNTEVFSRKTNNTLKYYVRYDEMKCLLIFILFVTSPWVFNFYIYKSNENYIKYNYARDPLPVIRIRCENRHEIVSH